MTKRRLSRVGGLLRIQFIYLTQPHILSYLIELRVVSSSPVYRTFVLCSVASRVARETKSSYLIILFGTPRGVKLGPNLPADGHAFSPHGHRPGGGSSFFRPGPPLWGSSDLQRSRLHLDRYALSAPLSARTGLCTECTRGRQKDPLPSSARSSKDSQLTRENKAFKKAFKRLWRLWI